MWIPPSEAPGLADTKFLDDFKDINESCNLKPSRSPGSPSHCACLRGNPLSITIAPSTPTELSLASMPSQHQASVAEKDHHPAAYIGAVSYTHLTLPTICSV